MKTRLSIFLPLYSVAAIINCFSQDSTTHRTVFPAGIDAWAGVGYFATRDEHISQEKYTGPSSSFALSWSNFHETYGCRIGLAYEKESHIKNYNVSAEVTQGAFALVDLYPIGKVELFGDDVFIYLGPSAEAFIYYRRQNIAQNTDAIPNIYESGSWLFSLGARVEMILPLKWGIQIEAGLQTSLLSLGGGTGNNSNNSTPITLLTPLAGERGSGEVGFRYFLLTGVSVAVGYRLQVTRIDSWNYILASSDNAFASLGLYL
jgi:hypothetical protein